MSAEQNIPSHAVLELHSFRRAHAFHHQPPSNFVSFNLLYRGLKDFLLFLYKYWIFNISYLVLAVCRWSSTFFFLKFTMLILPVMLKAYCFQRLKTEVQLVSAVNTLHRQGMARRMQSLASPLYSSCCCLFLESAHSWDKLHLWNTRLQSYCRLPRQEGKGPDQTS